MNVGSGGKPTHSPSLKGGVFLYIPVTGIDSFRETQIEREGRVELPLDGEIAPAAQTIHRRDGEGIEDIMLIGVDTVRPLARIKSLQAEMKA